MASRPQPSLPDPHGNHSITHVPVVPGPGPSSKKSQKKSMALTSFRPCSSSHSASHALWAAQAWVTVRKWGSLLGQEWETRGASSSHLEPEADADWLQRWLRPLSRGPTEGACLAAGRPPGQLQDREPASHPHPPLMGCGARAR